MRNKIRVILAEDHQAYLYGLETYLKNNEEIELLPSAKDGKELMMKIHVYQPEVVVTDLFMPGLSGTDLVRKIFEAGVDRLVICSLMESDFGIHTVLNSGAMSYVSKCSDLVEIARAIKSTYHFTPYFCSHISRKINRLMGSIVLKGSFKNIMFNNEEKQIIILICQEKTSVEIAGQLYKSKKYIDRARTRIFEKMGVKSSAGLVVYAIRNSMFPDFHPSYVM